MSSIGQSTSKRSKGTFKILFKDVRLIYNKAQYNYNPLTLIALTWKQTYPFIILIQDDCTSHRNPKFVWCEVLVYVINMCFIRSQCSTAIKHYKLLRKYTITKSNFYSKKLGVNYINHFTSLSFLKDISSNILTTTSFLHTFIHLHLGLFPLLAVFS